MDSASDIYALGLKKILIKMKKEMTHIGFFCIFRCKIKEIYE